MLDLKTLCRQLYYQNVVLRISDEQSPDPRLWAGPREAISEEQSDAIRHHKAAIINLLQRHAAYCIFTHPDRPGPCKICHPDEENHHELSQPTLFGG